MVTIKSLREINLMRKAGEIVAEVLELVGAEAEPGLRTGVMDAKVEKVILERGGHPAFKGYRGYPASLCVSINEQVVHGIPGERRLEEGDVVSFDVGVRYKNYYADAAVTVGVGKVGAEAGRLMKTCRKALSAAVDQVKPGGSLREVSAAIQHTAEEEGFSVVRQFVGHGIGSKLHEEPQVPNFVDDYPEGGLILKPGMVLAIEPMVNAGGYEVEVEENGWTVITSDRSLSAHYEHTVAVTEDGAQVLTA